VKRRPLLFNTKRSLDTPPFHRTHAGLNQPHMEVELIEVRLRNENLVGRVTVFGNRVKGLVVWRRRRGECPQATKKGSTADHLRSEVKSTFWSGFAIRIHYPPRHVLQNSCISQRTP